MIGDWLYVLAAALLDKSFRLDERSEIADVMADHFGGHSFEIA